MIRDTIEAIITATKKLFGNWGALLIALALYTALLVVTYLFFVVVKEATKLEVALTVFILPMSAVIFFFALQAMGLSYMRISVGAGYMLKRALKDCWKLLLVSLPVLLLAWLVIYFVDFPEPKYTNGAEAAAEPWGYKGLRTAAFVGRYLSLYFAFPLLAIHLWIATVREGLGQTFKGVWRNLRMAFSPRSVLIYLLVVTVSGAGAYFFFFTRAQVKSDWGELWLFGGRLALALLTVFVGWMVTLGAMAEMTARQALSKMDINLPHPEQP